MEFLMADASILEQSQMPRTPRYYYLCVRDPIRKFKTQLYIFMYKDPINTVKNVYYNYIKYHLENVQFLLCYIITSLTQYSIIVLY